MPQAWDLVKQEQDRVLIVTLLAPPLMVSIDWAYAFTNLQKPPLYDVIRLSGLPFGEARTHAGYECLNRGYNWLFFLDADVIAPPETLIKLISHRLPVTSALYFQKFKTWTGMDALHLPCMFNEGKDAQGNPVRVEITDFQYGQLVEATYVPAGCLLVHRSVFERFLASGIKRFFQWTLTADNPTTGTSEDFNFSRTCWQLGYKVIVDTGIVAIHEALAKVDLKGLSPKI